MRNILLAGGKRALLQTAQVVVYGKDGVQFQACILMKNASHRTFMTEQMVMSLNLPPQQVESLSVSTFGTKSLKIWILMLLTSI